MKSNDRMKLVAKENDATADYELWTLTQITLKELVEAVVTDRYECGAIKIVSGKYDWFGEHNLYYKYGNITADIIPFYMHERKIKECWVKNIGGSMTYFVLLEK